MRVKVIIKIAATATTHRIEYSSRAPDLLLTVMLPGPSTVAAVIKPGPIKNKIFEIFFVEKLESVLMFFS
jgi:hypothetical protein